MLLRYMLEEAVLIPAAVLCFLPMRKSFRRPALTYALAAVLIPLLIVAGGFLRNAGFPNAVVYTYAVCALLFVPTWRLSRLSLGKVAFCFANAASLCAWCNMYANFLMAPIEQAIPDEPFTVQSSLVVLGSIVVIGAFFFPTLWSRLPRMQAEPFLDRAWPSLSLVPIGLTLLFAWITPLNFDAVMSGRVRAVGLSALLLFPVVMWLLFYLPWWITVHIADDLRLEQENQLLRAESLRYRELEAYVNETRTLRHDFRQHLRVLTELASSNRNDELREYLEQMQDSAVTRYTRYSANPAVDAIVGFFMQQAQTSGIEIDGAFELPESLPLAEADCCVILGNLLENACFAVLPLPEEQRKIRVAVRMLSEAMLGLLVENPCGKPVRFDADGLPVSMRPGHGLGLRSVKALVDRYHGTMEISSADNRFSVHIVLFL